MTENQWSVQSSEGQIRRRIREMYVFLGNDSLDEFLNILETKPLQSN